MLGLEDKNKELGGYNTDQYDIYITWLSWTELPLTQRMNDCTCIWKRIDFPDNFTFMGQITVLFVLLIMTYIYFFMFLDSTCLRISIKYLWTSTYTAVPLGHDHTTIIPQPHYDLNLF